MGAGGLANDFAAYNPATFYGTTNNYIKKGTPRNRVFTDSNGFRWRVAKLSTALAGGVTAAGQILVVEDPENFIVTNDVSAGFSATVPIAAGLCTGVFSQSGATDDTDKWVLLLVEGIYNTAKTDGGDDIVEGDLLVPSTTVDGTFDRLAFSGAITDPGDTPASADALRDDLVANTIPSIETLFSRLAYSVCAWALDDDVNADDTVKIFIKTRW